MQIRRFAENPIIRPHMDERMGSNINGPSLIRVPDWVADPLGKYYLYFANHGGKYIRIAYADDLHGPWQIHSPGALDIEGSFFTGHIASPDVIVVESRREIRMYYHGCGGPGVEGQQERAAVSSDGLHFTTREELLGNSYWRVFEWSGYWYALAMPGTFYRSEDGLTNFEQGPTLFTPNMRHSAVRLQRDALEVLYSNAHDCPERILLSTIELTPDWMDWRAAEPVTVLEPEMDYEGGNLPLAPSQRGAAHEPVRQLRDPCLFEEDGKWHLLYSVAGERGVGIGEVG